jgi:hypothetical protein
MRMEKLSMARKSKADKQEEGASKFLEMKATYEYLLALRTLTDIKLMEAAHELKEMEKKGLGRNNAFEILKRCGDPMAKSEFQRNSIKRNLK